ncbi:MAG: hypothetical protein KY428_10600, partial [Bacteroidetes bacterium]|nr:hypothetical protein [Bacteroidota bacterium]
MLMRHAESIIRSTLDTRIQQATEGYYSTSFDYIELNYARRDFIIHNLHMFPDSARMVDRKGNSINPGHVYNILIPQLRIEGIALKKAYLDQELLLEQLVVDKPEIKLFFNLDLPPAAIDSLKQDINKRLSLYFKTIQAAQLEIRDGRLDLHAVKNGQKSRIKTILNLEADKLRVTPASTTGDKDWLQIDRFLLQTGTTVGHIADKTYLLKLKNLTASSADSSLYLQGFQLIPLASIDKLLNEKPDIDRIYNISVPQLYSYGINYSDLYNEQIYTASELTLISPILDLFDAKPSGAGEKENFMPEDLYPAMEKILHKVSVGQIFVRHGKAQVRNSANTMASNFKANIREASVFNFELDSAAHIRND